MPESVNGIIEVRRPAIIFPIESVVCPSRKTLSYRKYSLFKFHHVITANVIIRLEDQFQMRCV